MVVALQENGGSSSKQMVAQVRITQPFLVSLLIKSRHMICLAFSYNFTCVKGRDVKLM